MSGTGFGLLLALVASLALNGGYLLQHAGSLDTPPITPRHPLRSLAGLLSSRVWIGGAVLGSAGWAAHVGALSHAPLSLVQAFVAGGLVLAVPLATRLLGHRLTRGEKAAIALMAVSLALLTLGQHGVSRGAHFSGPALGAYLCGAAAFAATLGLLPAGRGRATILGLAGGILYGAADMAIKALTGAHGPGAALASPWLLAAVGLTAAAFFCFQRGLQSGSALPVIAVMTAATNVVSIGGGLLILGDGLGRTPLLAAVHLAAFALVVVAAWQLSPTQAALATGGAAVSGAPLRAAGR